MKSHCIHGHPLTGDNVYYRADTGGDGRPVQYPACRICKRRHERECQRRRRARNAQVEAAAIRHVARGMV